MSGKPLLASLAVALVVALGIGATLLLNPQPRTVADPVVSAPHANASAPADARTQQARTTNASLSQTPVAALADPGPLPPSLQGSRPDVRLQVDANGNLRIAEDILRIFDFYLSGLEEEDIATVLARIHRDLAAQLQGPALAQARDLLRRYVDYRIALQDLPQAGSELDLAQLRSRLDAVTALRNQYFSAEEASTFFARESAEDHYMLQRLAITRDATLPADQQQQALAELENQLPDELRESRASASRYAELYDTTSSMQANGASAEEIRLVREKALGSAAADSLAELDQQHAAWDRRLADYASERNKLRGAGLSAADLQSALLDLQSSRFDELERKRVQALDADL